MPEGVRAVPVLGRTSRRAQAASRNSPSRHPGAIAGLGATAAGGDEDRTRAPHLVEQQQRDRHHQHREQVGAGRQHRARDEGEHDGKAAEAVELRRPDHAEPGQDDDDQRQLEGDPQRERHLHHEAEVLVVGDERRRWLRSGS